MNNPHSHQNARLGFAGRACLVERVLGDGWTAPDAAAAFHVSARTVWKWVRRFRDGGRAALQDRTSRPRRSPRQLAPALERRITRLRAKRRSGPQIADALALPLDAVEKALVQMRSPRPETTRGTLNVTLAAHALIMKERVGNEPIWVTMDRILDELLRLRSAAASRKRAPPGELPLLPLLDAPRPDPAKSPDPA